jgi:hypothetical protein
MSNHLKRVQRAVRCEINIQLLESGQVRVMFPMGKDALCQEMLKEAATVIRTSNAEQKSQIVAPGNNAIVEV